MKFKIRCHSPLMLVASTMALSQGAVSQSKEFNSAGEASLALEEIVVTAQKREGNLQKVPVAVTAISAVDIQEARIQSARDILNQTPGATFVSPSPVEQVFSIRGISSGNEAASSDSGVLMMIDGEVIARDFMRSSAFFDVGRIEILRGPQGTTYGRNSTGGVFHVISNAVSQEFDSNLQIDVGNYGLLEAEAFINGALSETVAGRLSGYFSERDGYSKDVIRDIDVDYAETAAVRGKLLIEPGAHFSIKLTGHYSSEDVGPPAQKISDPSLSYDGPAGFSFDSPSANPYRVANSDVKGFQRDIYGASVSFDWYNESIDITSITALRIGEADVDRDLFGTDSTVIRQLGIEKSTTINHESRVSSTQSSDDIQWMAGIFYLNEDTERDEIKVIFPDYLGGFLSSQQDMFQTNKTNAYGLFGDLVYSMTDQTSVGVGLRYSYDVKDYSVIHSANGLFANAFLDSPPGPVIGALSESWESVTWKLSLNHQLTPDALLYATLGNGVKAGGFNPEPRNELDALVPFDQETVMSYELGAKMELFDDSLRLNVAAFHSNFSDIQEEFFTPSGSTIIANVASAEISGLELESLWRVNKYLTLALTGSSYDHSYDSFIDASGNDNSGNPIANVPDWTLNVSTRINIPIPADRGELRARLDVRSRSDIVDDADTDHLYGIRPVKEIVDVRFTWTSPGQKYEFALWGKNVLDEAEISNIGPYGGMSQRQISYQPPMTAGLSLNINLGG